MAKMKLGNHGTLELLLLSIFGVSTLFLAFIYFIAPNWKNEALAAMLFCLGMFLNNVIFLIKNNIKKSSIISSDFYNDLYDIGVMQIYPKRKKSEEEGYLHDLLEDFGAVNKLNKWHIDKKEPIKVLGLALGKYFLYTKIKEKIEEYCKEVDFRLMFCKEGNKELESRLGFVNRKFEKLTKNNDWKCASFEDTPLFAELIDMKNKIHSLEENINSRIEARQYDFSPFATIIIINDHIYYTPNVIEYLNYVKPNRLPSECNEYIYEAELSIRIQRKSEFGVRLEKLFESLWENTACDNIVSKETIAKKNTDENDNDSPQEVKNGKKTLLEFFKK